MKKVTKKTLAVVLAILMVVQVVPSAVVHAAAPSVQKKLKLWLYDSMKSNTAYIYIQNPVKKGKITKIKNSKPSIAKVTAGANGYLAIMPKSEGTTKVTFQYAKKKLTTKITVVKWVNPCKEFKIGKKNYAKNFEKSGHYNLNQQKKDKDEKIKIVPKKGWKLVKIERFTMDSPVKKVKNNSKINLTTSGTGTGVYVYFKNTKTGKIRKLYFGYSSVPIPSTNYYDSQVEE